MGFIPRHMIDGQEWGWSREMVVGLWLEVDHQPPEVNLLGLKTGFDDPTVFARVLGIS